MNEPLSITLLGGLEVQQGDRLITRFKSQKIGALLAYLAYHLPQMHSREILIDRFWPESTLEAGRNSLSVALSTLRHQLEPPGTPANAILRADRFSIGLNPAAVSTDVARFEAAVQAAMKTENSAEQIQRLAAAADLYRGRLLPGFYDDWITSAQEHLGGLLLDILNRLIGRSEASGDLAGALRYARRAVDIESLHEQANQHLLRLLAVTGQPGAALRHYKELEQRLDTELGEEPSAPLRALARQIEKQSGFTLPLALPATVSPQPLHPPVFAPAPEGLVTLTFLLTDIEGSTQQWERTGDLFTQALASHHTLLRHAFAQAGGQEINEAGDSFVVAFASAKKALNCAIAAQQALHEHTWPPETGALRVRMALHTGDVEFQEGTHHGLTLHRAARMLTTGHGEQILCSEATASLVRREPGEAARLVDLGVWRLRDVPTPERLFQVEYPGMSEHPFPPLAAQSGQAAHLPLRFTRFFGRDGEIAHLVERLRPDPLLSAPPVRLVTLTGLGGAGKTRLALEVAERLVEPYAGAVWFAPLADISDPRLLADTILGSLRLVRSPQQEPLAQVIEALSRQPSLLILDNFEQIVEGGAALVQTLLSRVPTLTVLVTSRQLLGLAGEEEFVVPPLNTPNGEETAAQLSLYDSVRLFVDRAQAAMPHFQITNGNAPAVAELCHRLEGIPLAIELAAARAMVLTPAQMLKQLEQRFGFLVSRKRDTSERHKTLEAAIEWSYRLLTPEVQRFFVRLSVFRGGWTAEAAEAVCEEPLALDYLAQLRECSLVLVEENVEGMRFRMLESLREYAGEQLPSVERSNYQQRHATYFFTEALAGEVENHAHEVYHIVSLRMRQDRENYYVALRWWQATDANRGVEMLLSLHTCGQYSAFSPESLDLMLRLASQALPAPSPLQAKLYLVAGMWAVYRGLLVREKLLKNAVTLAEGCSDKTTLACALYSLGEMALYQGELDQARELLGTSLDCAMQTGDMELAASVQKLLINVACAENDFERAQKMSEALVQAGREKNHWYTITRGLEALAHLAEERQDDAHARDYLEQAMTFYPAWIPVSRSNTLRAIGRIASRQEDYDAARNYLDKSLTICQETDDQAHEGWTYHDLAYVAYQQGSAEEAITWEKKALRLFERLGEVGSRSLCLGRLAQFLGNQPEKAAFLWNACKRNALESGSPLGKAEAALEALKTVLTEEALATIQKRVASLSPHELIQQALSC